METTLPYVTLGLAAATLLMTIYLAVRLRAVHYLLQQPVVKKLSPQLRLKPVKLDEAFDRSRDRGRDGNREGRDRDRGRDGRPDRGNDRRPEGPRDGQRERNDGDRNREVRDRDRGRDGRPDRGNDRRPEGPRDGQRERNDGDRNREGRDRDRGRDRRDDRRPPREFSETRDFAPPPQPEFPATAGQAPAGLPPRRPLPSFAETPADREEAASASAPSSDSRTDGIFAGSGDDVQHGRRTQLKKKPRFDFDEEESTAA